MHVLVDALSVNNLSGRHVLLGHLRELTRSSTRCRFTLLAGAANEAVLDGAPEGVARHRAPVGSGWVQRLAWQLRHGASLCRDLGVDAVFSPSGMASAGLPRPQLVLAQNPWPLVASFAPGADAVKTALQRRAFARAQRGAEVMAFNSSYMQELYASRFGPRRGESIVAYQGIEESLFAAGAASVGHSARSPRVLCVSVMARHKAVETLVEAFALVVSRLPEARMDLVGGWPDQAYRAEIEARVAALGLGDRVSIRGHVEHAELLGLYAGARAFCLLSRCESFGIPAVEAQAFGTPAVVAAGTAAPEIIGKGGRVVAQDDVPAAAAELTDLLHAGDWAERSRAARDNAERFHWSGCSAPLVAAFDAMAQRHVR